MKFPRPYFRTQRNCWCLQLDGKQITLGSDRDEAFLLYHKIMAERRSPAPRPLVGVALSPVLDRFLEWCQTNRAPRTYDWYRDYLQSFLNTVPGLIVQDLRPFHVQQWVDTKKGWQTSKRGAIISVQRALN